jgi:hypothetical protein
MGNVNRIFMYKPFGRHVFEIPRKRRENNIKMHFSYLNWEVNGSCPVVKPLYVIRRPEPSVPATVVSCPFIRMAG